MFFYDEWITKKNTTDENRFILSFLSSDDETTCVFHEGTQAELGTAISVITSVPMETFIQCIDQMELSSEVKSIDVPQFSSFGAATNRLPEILEFSPEGLSFAEIGYQLVKSPNDSAGTKYGENHAKLAEMLDLVKIHNRPSKVTSTKLGKYLLGFKPEEKVELLKRLLLRQFLIKKLIHDAGEGNVEYISEVRLLSKSTAARRGRNVRMLLDYILEGTDDEARIQRIDWDVK
jgi:hypothetical protein